MAGGLQPPSEEEEKKAAAAKEQGVIFILENASLEVARVGKVSSASVHLPAPAAALFWHRACMLTARPFYMAKHWV